MLPYIVLETAACVDIVFFLPISFVPPGDHSVEVRLGGMLIPGAPFVVKAYDVNKVKVTDVQNGIVGKPVYFCSKWTTGIY